MSRAATVARLYAPRFRRWPALLLTVLLLLASCGDEAAPEVEVPSWAMVAPEQIAEAAKHGVPVAFENDIGMRFVLIPAGTFLMGSPEDEEGRTYDETQHEVTITKPFYMSIYEVTNGQFRRLNPEHLGGRWATDDTPVLGVTWWTGDEFARGLSSIDGEFAYALPTEAQWEYACRAGTTSPYSTGPDLTHDQARFRTAREAAVGSYPPNGWGLYDMHGNAAEWCSDWFEWYSDHAALDPSGSATGAKRILRGGGSLDEKKRMRSASRWPHNPGHAFHYFGFRLVSPLPEKAE